MVWKVTDSILDLVGETAGSHGLPRVKMQNMEEVPILITMAMILAVLAIMSIKMILSIMLTICITIVIWIIMTSVLKVQQPMVMVITQVFSYMDTNKDGVVTEEEFMAYCTSNNNYTNNLLVLP